MHARIHVIVSTLLAIAALGYVAACGSEDGLPTGNNGGAGTLTVALNTAHTDGAAMRVTLTGQNISNVQAAGGVTLFQRTPVNNTVNIVLVGSLTSGTAFTFDVADTEASYSVVVEEVAGTDNALLAAREFGLTIES